MFQMKNKHRHLFQWENNFLLQLLAFHYIIIFYLLKSQQQHRIRGIIIFQQLQLTDYSRIL